MSHETKAAPSLRLFSSEPEPKRRAKVGIVIPTHPYPVEEEVDTQLHFNQEGIGRYEQTPHSVGAKYWKIAYEKAYKAKGHSQESAWATYSGNHFSIVDGINVALRRNKNGNFWGQEENYYDPEFFRRKLFSKTLRADNIYYYGLIALRIGIKDQRKAREFESLGFALLEKAEEMDPRNPKKKLALWKEHVRIAEERPNLKRKAEKETQFLNEKYRLTPALINRLKNPELGREFSTMYYVEKTDHWADILEEVSKGRKIDYQEFKKQHAISVTAAGKEMDDRRGPDKRRTRFTPSFFANMLTYDKLDAFNAYYWGLVALHTPTKIEHVKSQLELLGFTLLERAHELSVVERMEDGKKPSAYYPWAIQEEYLVKMARPGIQSKRQVRGRELGSMIARAWARNRGGLLQHINVTNQKPISEPTSPLDEIPR